MYFLSYDFDLFQCADTGELTFTTDRPIAIVLYPTTFSFIVFLFEVFEVLHVEINVSILLLIPVSLFITTVDLT